MNINQYNKMLKQKKCICDESKNVCMMSQKCICKCVA